MSLLTTVTVTSRVTTTGCRHGHAVRVLQAHRAVGRLDDVPGPAQSNGARNQAAVSAEGAQE